MSYKIPELPEFTPESDWTVDVPANRGPLRTLLPNGTKFYIEIHSLDYYKITLDQSQKQPFWDTPLKVLEWDGTALPISKKKKDLPHWDERPPSPSVFARALVSKDPALDVPDHYLCVTVEYAGKDRRITVGLVDTTKTHGGGGLGPKSDGSAHGNNY